MITFPSDGSVRKHVFSHNAACANEASGKVLHFGDYRRAVRI